MNDDVTSYTGKLSEMERRLFARGALASANHTKWKRNGNRRLTKCSAVTSNINKTATAGDTSSDSKRTTTTTQSAPDNKRQRI